VQQRRVVPNDDIADPVFEPVPILLLRRVVPQLIEQVDGFVLTKLTGLP